jgi:hypothetical protein
MEEEQLQQRAIGERGDWGCDAAFCRRANGDFREGAESVRELGGEELGHWANQQHVRAFACKFRGPFCVVASGILRVPDLAATVRRATRISQANKWKPDSSSRTVTGQSDEEQHMMLPYGERVTLSCASIVSYCVQI